MTFLRSNGSNLYFFQGHSVDLDIGHIDEQLLMWVYVLTLYNDGGWIIDNSYSYLVESQ